MFDTWLRTVLGDSTRLDGDLGVGPAAGDQLEDLALALGELRERLGVGAGRRPGEEVHQPPGHARAEDRVARRHRADRPDQLRALGALEQVAAGAGAHRREHRLVVVVHRQHEDRDVRRRVDDPARGLDAVEPGHVDVHQHDVRVPGRDRGDRLLARRGLARPGRCRPRSPAAAARPARNAAWSSATRTRIRSARLAHGAAARPSGRRARTRVPPSGRRSTATSPPTSAARSCIDSRPVPRRGDVGQAAAVVGDLDRQLAVGAQRDAARARPGVADGVGHGLDRDPVGRDLDGRGQLGQVGGLDADPRSDAVPRASSPPPIEARRLLADRAREAELVERGRAEAVHEPADVGERLAHLLAERLELAPAPPRDPSPAPRDEASARIPMAASVGPSPSWRSRRSRRRSSSRASTSRSRDRDQVVAQAHARGPPRRPGAPRSSSSAELVLPEAALARSGRRGRAARPAPRRGRSAR